MPGPALDQVAPVPATESTRVPEAAAGVAWRRLRCTAPDYIDRVNPRTRRLIVSGTLVALIFIALLGAMLWT